MQQCSQNVWHTSESSYKRRLKLLNLLLTDAAAWPQGWSPCPGFAPGEFSSALQSIMWLHLVVFCVLWKEFSPSVWLEGQQGNSDGPVTCCLFVISEQTLATDSTYLRKHPSDISCINCLHSEPPPPPFPRQQSEDLLDVVLVPSPQSCSISSRVGWLFLCCLRFCPPSFLDHESRRLFCSF